MSADTTIATTPMLHRQSTIDALPPEIILSIMKTGMSQTIRDQRSFELVCIRIPFDHKLSQVCRRWRTIALSCSELWSTVPHPRSSTEWTELCISRCSSGPIDCIVPQETFSRDAHCQQVICLVLSHIARVRTIEFPLDKHDDTDSFVAGPSDEAFFQSITDALITRSASLLEEIDMHFCLLGNLPGDWRPRYYALPLDIFVRQCPPRLWRVKLQRCIISLPSPLFGSSLRHLELIDVRCWKNIDDTIRCLQSTPSLETLRVHDFYMPWVMFDEPLFAESRSSTHSTRCVHLQRLRTLDLSATFAQNSIIFSHLEFPSTASVNLMNTADGSTDLSDHFTMLAEALTAHFASASAAGLHFNVIRSSKYAISASAIPPEPDGLVNLPDTFHLVLLVLPSPESREQCSRFLVTCLSLPVFLQAEHATFDKAFNELYPEVVETLALLKSQGNGTLMPL